MKNMPQNKNPYIQQNFEKSGYFQAKHSGTPVYL